MISIILGLITLVIGVWGLYSWWDIFIMFVKGFLPVSIIIVSFIAIIAGISSLRDTLKKKSNGS